jgi:hypothetical protein
LLFLLDAASIRVGRWADARRVEKKFSRKMKILFIDLVNVTNALLRQEKQYGYSFKIGVCEKYFKQILLGIFSMINGLVLGVGYCEFTIDSPASACARRIVHISGTKAQEGKNHFFPS